MRFNWKGDGTPAGCDSHCIPHPCGPCHLELDKSHVLYIGASAERTRVRTQPKYSFEIDVSDREYETGTGQWANYGTLVTEGNNLDELLDNASVDVMDQDGGELFILPADSSWIQDLIQTEWENHPDQKTDEARHDKP